MDIGSGNAYPANALSNFAPHPFEIDGIKCNSMEGFLQSLKFSNPDMQAHICTLVGRQAKAAGANKNWQTTQLLWWRGVPMRRNSKEYQFLLQRAYAELGKNEGFKRALLASGKSVLTHNIGRTNENETVLTRKEFCGILTALRNVLNGSTLF